MFVLVLNFSLSIDSDEREQLWVWEFTNDDGQKTDLFMEVGEKIRFTVKEVIFKDTTPPVSSTEPHTAGLPSGDIQRKTPFSIRGSITDYGLGLLSWWD